ncbi:NADP-dependent oxidoreductase [Beijerinckia sp. L45]|uniref:NADP-dependent oxidoreductase n=1 Tax=Beijerinckia sp. L45 TaxID=1641855 RepID=UPI00131D34A2|nr:NADP-dependent oxidoreductase [Beijerinckia sp. L45]
MTDNKRVVLASRPNPNVSLDNFRLETAALTPLGDGEVRVRNHYLSLDPYMRGRMSDAKNYAAPQALDAVMIGGTVGDVVESRNPAWTVGDKVVGIGGWQEFTTSAGADMRKIQGTAIPLSAYLGSVGMPGVTAWYGLNRICKVTAGETIVVSAASGAVGSVVGQLAKMKGARVVGIAGGPEKCAYVTETLGFDACVDYKAGALDSDLEAATPKGIDAYFENVGGEATKVVIQRINAFGRIAVCGLISIYDNTAPTAIDFRRVLIQRLTIEGFIVSEHMEVWPEALKELGALVATGKLQFRESIADGLASAPEAFLGLLKGKNFGKQLVKLI